MDTHAGIIERMQQIEQRLVDEGDELQHFHGAYLRTTTAVFEDAAAGRFQDPEWAERWGVAFAQLYLDAYDAWKRGGDTPGPWRVAFEATTDHAITPLHHSLLGINAHINYDLPQAMLAVISSEDFADEALLASRMADHAHVDSIIVSHVPDEDRRLEAVEEPGDRTLLDRLMRPLNTAGTRRFLQDGRRKTWHNSRILDAARRRGPEVYAWELSVLERLCEDRITDLIEPRFVIMRLARIGFGVELQPPAG